jgi:protein-L-isoaspartate(D-aspartate) O-methyltransferase
MMTEMLELKGGERVLEIGTGSGYQTAVLALLCSHVYTIERLRGLANGARKVLYDIGITNFTIRIGDGTLGWPDAAPFDGIIVTAGAPKIPAAYTGQLADGGRLVIPVGGEATQELLVVKRNGAEFTKRTAGGCRFVKLIGENGWKGDM